MRIVLLLLLTLSGCGLYRHNDGMGDLWRGVRECNAGRCDAHP